MNEKEKDQEKKTDSEKAEQDKKSGEKAQPEIKVHINTEQFGATRKRQ